MKHVNSSNNSMLSYFLILGSVFVIIFFTKNFFLDLQVSLAQKSDLVSQIQEKTEELSKLNKLQKDIENPENPEMKEIKKYSQEVSEKSLLEFFYYYAAKQNALNPILAYKSLSLGTEETSSLGLQKRDIHVSSLFASENDLFNFLNMITKENENYQMFMQQFSYDMNKSGSVQAEIPLTLYFK